MQIYPLLCAALLQCDLLDCGVVIYFPKGCFPVFPCLVSQYQLGKLSPREPFRSIGDLWMMWLVFSRKILWQTNGTPSQLNADFTVMQSFFMPGIQ